MDLKIKKVSLSSIKLNPNNPRKISEKAMGFLEKSIHSFPEMLNLREIVIDETGTILGGNMRFLALKKLGITESTVKIIKGLTAEQKKEFIIKDNANWGAWDYEILANRWDDLPLLEWQVAGLGAEVDKPDAEWQGMPEFNDDGEAIKSVHAHFKTGKDVAEFSKLIGQEIGEKTKYIWFPKREREIHKDKAFISES